MSDAPPLFGQQHLRYHPATGRVAVMRSVHSFLPRPGEADAQFLARILNAIPASAGVDAELVLYRRDGRITQIETILTPASPLTPG